MRRHSLNWASPKRNRDMVPWSTMATTTFRRPAFKGIYTLVRVCLTLAQEIPHFERNVCRTCRIQVRREIKERSRDGLRVVAGGTRAVRCLPYARLFCARTSASSLSSPCEPVDEGMGMCEKSVSKSCPFSMGCWSVSRTHMRNSGGGGCIRLKCDAGRHA